MTETTLPSDAPPRSAFSALQRRMTLAIVAALGLLAGWSWWYTVGAARDMSAMVTGVAEVGRAMPFDMTAGLFMGMWVAMMVAMMFPTIAPIVLLHRSVVQRRGQGPLPTIAFVGGYLVIWTVVGLVPLAALVGFRHVADESLWVARGAGVVLVIAGLYQFTGWKAACLKACRSPLSFLMTHDFGSGWIGAARTGLSHGLSCLGCCWALMAVLFAVGLMNLAWMALIAVIFLAEKNWRRGVGLTLVVGVAVTLLGLAVLVYPDLLTTVAPARADMTTMN